MPPCPTWACSNCCAAPCCPWQLAITLPLLVVAPIALLRLLPVKRMSLARQTRLNLLAALLGAVPAWPH